MATLQEKLTKLRALYNRRPKYQYHWPQYFAVVNHNMGNHIKVWVESYHEPDFDYAHILKRNKGKDDTNSLFQEAYTQGWTPETTTDMLEAMYKVLLGSADVRGIPHEQLVVMFMDLLGTQFRNLTEAIEHLRPMYVNAAENYLEELAEKEEEDLLDIELDAKIEVYINSKEVLDELENKFVVGGLSSIELDDLLIDMAAEYRTKLKKETANEKRGLRIVD